MNRQERELEQLVDEIEATNISVPPLFELYVTVLSIGLSIMMFAYPSMINDYPSNLYDSMLVVMPQGYWAMSFFIACMFKAVGLLWDKNSLRIIGLSLSALLYFTLTICYAVNFPSIGTITFGLMALFSVISILFVKHTSIQYKKENKK